MKVFAIGTPGKPMSDEQKQQFMPKEVPATLKLIETALEIGATEMTTPWTPISPKTVAPAPVPPAPGTPVPPPPPDAKQEG